MADPTCDDLLKFSYGEVIDATKHQDDKVGRVLAAVAFLTGGALVFVKTDFLKASYHLNGRDYALTAIFLGAFLFFDFIAITLFILTVATPLTFPGLASDTQQTSRLFFHVIARQTENEWRGMWDGDPSADFEKDLIRETYNLASCVASKYQRSRIASTAFLAAIICLVPTLALAVDSVTRAGPPRWDESRRFLVAVPISLVVFTFVMWAWGQVRNSRRRKGEKSKREWPLLSLAFAYPIFVGCTIVNDGWHHAEAIFGMDVQIVAGGVVALAFARSMRSPKRGLWPTMRPYISFAIAASLVAFACLIASLQWSDWQLFYGVALALLILVDNLRPDRVPMLPTVSDTTGEKKA